MIILNSIVYDYTQKAVFDYALAALIILLLTLGILLTKAGRIDSPARLKPGIFLYVWLLLLRAHPRKNRIFGRIAIITGGLVAVLYVYNYLAIKNPGLFYDLNSITGRIEKVEEKTGNGANRIGIIVKGETFYVNKDKGYTGKPLTLGDSITLEYYRDTNIRLTADENKKVVRLELVE